jgi:hypothetical protein
MKNHVLRPLWVVLAAIALILVVRHFMVPDDFGVHGESFTYNFHRLSNIDEWNAFPLKYKDRAYCNECHEDKFQENQASAHGIVQCENCHGAALDHPDDPEALEIDRSRDLCLRCHTALAYPGSQRNDIPGIDPEMHNTDDKCSECHNPHNPDLEQM